MATKKEIEEKKDLAKILYLNGDSRKDIATRLGVSAVSITKWSTECGWNEIRAAQTITRPELVNKLLNTINTLIEQVGESNDAQMMLSLGDRLSKLASTIDKLDKKANIIDTIDVFMAFSKWLQYRSEFDPEVTPELVRTVNRMQDRYISEQAIK